MSGVIWRRHYSPNKNMAMPRHSSGEWERRREKITALYSEYELPRVACIMEETEGFSASLPQYKRKFKDWGITKYDKYSIKQLRYMYLQLVRRFRQGKEDTAFRLHGHVVNSSKVERTLQRAVDNEAFELVSEPDSTIVGSPCGISPFTPPKSTGVKLTALNGDRRCNDSILQRALASSRSSQTQYPHLAIPASPPPPCIPATARSSADSNAFDWLTDELHQCIQETHPYGDRFAVTMTCIPGSYDQAVLRIECEDCGEHDQITLPANTVSSDPNLFATWSILVDRFEKDHIFTSPHQYKVFNRMFPNNCEDNDMRFVADAGEGSARSSIDQDVRLVRCELLANSCIPNSAHGSQRRNSPRALPPLSIQDILMDSLWEGGA